MYLTSDQSVASWLLLPFALGFWQFAIPAISALVSKLAGGRAEGKQAAAGTNLQRDQLATQQYGTNQNALLTALMAAETGNMNRAKLDLDRRQFTFDAPDQRGATAVRGDLMSRAQDVNITHPRAHIPQITGGARPSMLSPETRQTGQAMTRDALMGQLKGDTFADVPQQNFGGAVLKPPTQTPLPQSNWLDKVLSVASPIAGIAGGLMTAQNDSQNQDWLRKFLEQQSAAGRMSQQPSLSTPPFNPNVNWMGGQ